MSVKCNYSKKFLPLVNAKFKELGVEGLKPFMEEMFEDGIDAYNKYVATMKGPDPKPAPTPLSSVPTYSPTKVNNKGSGIEASNDSSVISNYIGRIQEKSKMENRFKQRMVRLSIFDKDANGGKGSVIHPNAEKDGISNLNRGIADFKIELINNINAAGLKDPISFDNKMSDSELNAHVKNALLLYESLSTANKKLLLNDYVTLKYFDQILSEVTPYIQVKPEYENYVGEAINKYVYSGANVNFSHNWSQDETSDAFKEVSDLARNLLDVFPEISIDSNGNIRELEGTSIGVVGFTSAMAAMKNLLIFPPKTDSNSVVDIRSIVPEYYKGAQMDMSKVIQTYVDYLNANKQLVDKRRTFLINKLLGIKHFIYDSNLSEELKNVFTAMFYKNVPISYMAYQYDMVEGDISGRELDNKLADTQKYRLRDLTVAAIDQFRTNPALFKAIKEKYGIEVSQNKITFKYEEPGYSELGEIEVNYSNNPRNEHYYFSPTSVKLSNAITENLVKDLLNMIVPEDALSIFAQMNGIEAENEHLFDMFASMIGTTITASTYGDNKIDNVNFNYPVKKSGLVDLRNYNTALDHVAKVFSVIYGGDTVSVIRNAAGNNLPTYQLISLAYNFNSLVHDILTRPISDEYYNMAEYNLLTLNPDLVTGTSVRSDVTVGETTKAPRELSFNEVQQIAILNDFFQQLTLDTNNPNYGNIYIQNTTFSDKNTHFLIGYNLRGSLDDSTLGDILKDAMETGDTSRLVRIYTEARKNKVNTAVENVLVDYSGVFGKNFKSLAEINKYIDDNGLNESKVQKAFEDAGVIYYDNIHGYTDKASKKFRMNETMYNWHRTFNNPALVTDRLNRNKKRFIKNLISNGFGLNIYENSLANKFGSYHSDWVNQTTGKIKLFKAFDSSGNPKEINQNNITDILANDVVIQLNPILDTYFMADNILSNEYNSLMIGEIWAHPNKNKKAELYSDEYFEYSEANRLIAQNKRAVILGATHHPFLQGMKYGVEPRIDIAVIKDMPAYVQNMIGKTEDIDSMDGSGFSHPLQSRYENNSLIDARVGVDKKTIMHDMDPRYGRPTLLKWAVYSLTNARRRMSWGSRARGEDLYRKMSSKSIDTSGINLKSVYDDYVRENGYIYYKSPENGKVYRIVSVSNNSRTLVPVDPKTGRDLSVQPQTFEYEINNLYDLDVLFGGAWAMKDVNGQLEYREANLDLLEKITCEYGIKDSFIGYAVNKSAIKVGAGNINSSDVFTNDEPLKTISMSTKFGGVQMDADHELDMAEVTEMTQMLSALIQNGNSTEIVDKIYRDIGSAVQEALDKFNVAIKTNDSDKLYRLLGEALYQSFITNDRDTLGLAQAFINKANESLQKAQIDYKMPFSAPTVKGAFISTVTSMINKKGIRRKYSGFAGVLVPSYNMITYHNIGRKSYSFDGLINQMNKIRESNPLLKNASVQQLMNDYSINGQINPFLRSISQNEIDFEDTVVIVPKGEIPTPTNAREFYVNNWAIYDMVKNTNYGDVDVYIFDTKPRNLKGQELKFKINENGELKTYNVYDLPSCRAANLLSQKALNEEQSQFLANYIPSTFSGMSSAELAQAHPMLTEDIFIRWNALDTSAKQKYLVDETHKVLRAIKNKTLFDFGSHGQVQALEFENEPAQIIMGKSYAKQFGLLPGDEIADILEQGSEFFRNRLEANYSDISDKRLYSQDLYDAVLYTGDGKKVLVKVDSEIDSLKLLSKYPGFSEGSSFKVVGNDVFFNGDRFTDTEQKQFYQYTNEDGEIFDVIVLNSWDRLNQLKKSSLFDECKLHFTANNTEDLIKFKYARLLKDDPSMETTFYLPWKTEQRGEKQVGTNVALKDLTSQDLQMLEEQSFSRKLERLAENKFKSFKKSLNFVGARIPTQAMQSFMPLKVVMFSDSEINDVHVPAMQTWLQGSMKYEV